MADECSLKALQLAPDLAQAHASRSYALTINGKYTEAELEFEAAIGLDPQLYEAYYYAGRAYFAQGDFKKAAEAFRQAASIRPDDVTAAALLATTLRALGDTDDWKEACRHSITVAENYLSLNPDDALARSRVANDLIALGETEKGLEYAERAYAIRPNNCRYNVACANMVAGNTERALDLLEEHARLGGVHADWAENDSDWESVRDLPRFKAILEIARQSTPV